MARSFEDWMDEDEACLNCGETHFHQSKTPGICTECAGELMEQSQPRVLANH